MRILGIIPARGGSKGIPNKNKKLLAGKPLLEYTIASAKKASSLTEVIFSSEDDSLCELAQSLNVLVPFKRPDELASDTAGSLQVVQHAITQMQQENKFFDAVCLLQVTTPFRAENFIDNAIEKFKNANADSLVSVQKVPHQFNPHWVFEEQDGYLKIATGEESIIKRRQELPPAYIRDGAIYITKTEVLMEQHSFFGKSTAFIESDATSHVNIDTLEDWQRAETIAKQLFK